MTKPAPASTARRVVIAGGGTAGWMTAAALSHRLSHLGLEITLVESSDIGTIGVGEATVPAIRNYIAALGLDMFEVMRATSATFKLAIAFENWRCEGHTFLHSFGRYGASVGPADFHQLWRRLKTAGDTRTLSNFSLGVRLAEAGRFAEAPQPPRADFDVFDWAIHFDAGLFAKFLRKFSESRGVRRIDARIAQIRRDGADGRITALDLDNGASLEGDLFIDCTGFRSLLLQGVLGVGYDDWRRWLPCDRAIALPCAAAGSAITPFTRARAKTAGWTWRIPLQHRVGNGYVYSSDHISDDAAETALRADLEGEALAPPNKIRFTPGRVKTFWSHNCVGIGLAGGFLEPLESTSITLIQMGVDKLIEYWPQTPVDPRIAAEYNRISTLEYERIRDFIILHYLLNQRGDEPLWTHCRQMTPPDTLQHKIDLWRARGMFARYDWESFFDPSWLCMYDGFDVTPDAGDPTAEALPLAQIAAMADRIEADIAAFIAAAPDHLTALKRMGATRAQDQSAAG